MIDVERDTLTVLGDPPGSEHQSQSVMMLCGLLSSKFHGSRHRGSTRVLQVSTMC